MEGKKIVTIPVIDLKPWFQGDEAGRAQVATQVDSALRSCGFFLITNHGVSAESAATARKQVDAFLRLPDDVKRKYGEIPGGRGWLPYGVEADGQSHGGSAHPDVKESFVIGAEDPAPGVEPDGYFHRTNVWPEEVPDLRPALESHVASLRALADDMMEIFSVAMGRRPGFLSSQISMGPAWFLNGNEYPVAEMVPDQDHVGPHTDYGTFTILDREEDNGLHIWSGAEWEEAPFVPGSFTVNGGDLLAMWSGDQAWIAGRHRVKLTNRTKPAISLVYFFEGNPAAKVGGTDVIAGQYVKERLDATVSGDPKFRYDPAAVGA